MKLKLVMWRVNVLELLNLTSGSCVETQQCGWRKLNWLCARRVGVNLLYILEMNWREKGIPSCSFCSVSDCGTVGSNVTLWFEVVHLFFFPPPGIYVGVKQLLFASLNCIYQLCFLSCHSRSESRLWFCQLCGPKRCRESH